jgi:hypothetical protein
MYALQKKVTTLRHSSWKFEVKKLSYIDTKVSLLACIHNCYIKCSLQRDVTRSFNVYVINTLLLSKHKLNVRA